MLFKIYNKAIGINSTNSTLLTEQCKGFIFIIHLNLSFVGAALQIWSNL